MAVNQRKKKKTKKIRTPIPEKIQNEVLLGNRHACCVCQKPRVQLHHIDGNPSNNAPENIASLCVDHHDMASMQVGLTKKLTSQQVQKYKKDWENKCRLDLMALTRDRVNFFCTLYKNPPRIREQFLKLSTVNRQQAADAILKLIPEEELKKSEEGGFGFQQVPRANETTLACLESARVGQTWPSWLTRVSGHSEDADLPTDMGHPDGMRAFHVHDLYCQVMTQVLTAAQPPLPFEFLCQFTDPEDINTYSGALVSFREHARGKGVRSPRSSKEDPTSTLQVAKRKRGLVHRAVMQLRNMYVFSDTAAENLRNCRVCGVGILGGAEKVVKNGKPEMLINFIPLLIGMGGFGQSDRSGWAWNLR